MELRLFLIFLFSHFFGDFVVQNQSLCNQRFPQKEFCGRKKALKEMLRGNLKHCLIHLLVLIVMMIGFLFHGYGDIAVESLTVVDVMWRIFMYMISHFMIDLMKSYLTYEHKDLETNIFFFLLDQCLHLLVISLMFLNKWKVWVESFAANIQMEENTWMLIDRLLMGSIVVLFATFFAGIFIKIFMDHLDECNQKALTKNSLKRAKSGKQNAANQKDENREPMVNDEIDGEIRQGGYIIGILERSFILCALVVSTPQLIGFMLTVKSIVRLKKLSKDKFAEYFLIGNLLSFLFAILPGILLQQLW